MDAWTSLTLHHLTIRERHREAAQRRLAKLASQGGRKSRPSEEKP